MIDGGTCAGGRQDPQRNGEQHSDGHRRRSEFKSRGETLGDRSGDRLIRSQRSSKVPGREPGQKGAVLSQKRAIEPQPAAEDGDVLRRRRFSEHRLHRIARHKMNQRKHECRDAEQDGHGKQHAAQKKARHQSSMPKSCHEFRQALSRHAEFLRRPARWPPVLTSAAFTKRASNACRASCSRQASAPGAASM